MARKTYNVSQFSNRGSYSNRGTVTGKKSTFTNRGTQLPSYTANKTQTKPNDTDKKSTISILQPYPTSSGSSSSGSGGSGGYYINSMLEALKAGNQAAYDAQVQAARTANEQSLKNLSDAYNRYREDYTTNKANLENTYNTTASNLLKSLQRFQDQNAADVKSQRQDFLTNQSALETARAEADRQLRIDAARRGLGGSGLQQLAQLQTLLSQGQEVSKLANANQESMDTLRKALTQEMEDYNDDLKEAQNLRDTSLSALDTELKRKGEDYKTAVENANNNLRDLLAKYAAELATNNANAIATSYSPGSGSGSSSSDDELNIITGGLEATELNLADALNSLKNMSNKEVKNTYKKSLKTTDRNAIAQKLYNDALQESRAYRTNYGNKYRSAYNTSENNLRTILRNSGYNV